MNREDVIQDLNCFFTSSGQDRLTGTRLTLLPKTVKELDKIEETKIFQGVRHSDPWKRRSKWSQPLWLPWLLTVEDFEVAAQGTGAQAVPKDTGRKRQSRESRKATPAFASRALERRKRQWTPWRARAHEQTTRSRGKNHQNQQSPELAQGLEWFLFSLVRWEKPPNS